jgi:hypothetical protein
MQHSFNVVGVDTRICGGPQIKTCANFDVKLDVLYWKRDFLANYISSTASTEIFQFEGHGFILDVCNENKFIVLRFPLLGQAENIIGGVMLITDMPIPEDF